MAKRRYTVDCKNLRNIARLLGETIKYKRE